MHFTATKPSGKNINCTSAANLWTSRDQFRAQPLIRAQRPPSPARPQQQQQVQQQQRRPLVLLFGMRSQDSLVDHLKREGVVKHTDVEHALRQCDRAHYIDRGIPRPYVYQDSPLPIGYGETISAPHMHATCLELLRDHLAPGARVLDVGSGSGYLSTAMGLMVGPTGKVIGIEKHPELAEESLTNVRRDHPELLDSGAVELKAGNVLGNVLEGEAPFDAIHVGAAASSLPDVLVRKLKPGGRMVIPVGPQWEYQVMQCIDKDGEGHVKKHDLMYVRYVPLTAPGESSWEP